MRGLTDAERAIALRPRHVDESEWKAAASLVARGVLVPVTHSRLGTIGWLKGPKHAIVLHLDTLTRGLRR